MSDEQIASLSTTVSNSTCEDEDERDRLRENYTLGARSPNGPMRGRSVKEFEEQLTNLKKENFNLKLRIYFLEEKMGINFTLDKDNIVKKNIEHQIEIANLQDELQEKHELLCQAVKAMELQEEEYKKIIQAKDEEISHYTDFESIKLGSRHEEAAHKSEHSGSYGIKSFNFLDVPSDRSIKELENKILSLEQELAIEKENSASLQLVLDQAENYKARCEVLQVECNQKEEKLRLLTHEFEEVKGKLESQEGLIKELEVKLIESNQERQDLDTRLRNTDKAVEDLTGQLSEFKKKHQNVKMEFDREKKRLERLRAVSDMKTAELEEENEVHKAKIRELNVKLECAVQDVKKYQNLAVSKIADAAASPGAEKKNTSDVPLSPRKGASSTSSSPEKLGFGSLQQLLTMSSGESTITPQIRSELKTIISEHALQKQRIVKLKAEQLKACEIIKSMIDSRNKATDEIVQLKKQVNELEHELESVVSKPDKEKGVPLHTKLSDLNITAASPGDKEKSMAESQTEEADLMENYKAFISELEEKVEVLVATVNVKDSHIYKYKVQLEEMAACMAEKENRIVDLEFELLNLNQNEAAQQSSSHEKIDVGSEKQTQFFTQEIEEKNREIERLNNELKKCTCYLQEIVNKELWEKNREIEKMHSKHSNGSDILKLRKTLHVKEKQLQLLKDKIFELGVEVDFPEEELSTPKKMPTVLSNNILEENKMLQEKVKELEIKVGAEEANIAILKDDLSKTDKMRQESNEVCSILSTRLEELAIFLDSLLKQKCVLGFLGLSKNKKLKEIIENSLDLSRSFTMSMMINPEQSLAQLSNITALLNGSSTSIIQELSAIEDEESENSVLSINPSHATLTYQSHLYKQTKEDELNQSQVINALREQIINLKYELQIRDTELNKLNNFYNRDLSDKTTETDKELEAEVCYANALFNNKMNTTSTTLKYQSDNQSESESWSEPDRIVSRARIGLKNASLSGKVLKSDSKESTEDELNSSYKKSTTKNQIIDLNKQISDLQEKLLMKTMECQAFDQNMIEIKQNYLKQTEELEEKLQLAQSELKKSESKMVQVEEQLRQMKASADDLAKTRKELEEALNIKDKQVVELLNQIEQEREACLKTTRAYEKEIIDSKNQIQFYEDKLSKVNEEWEELKSNLKLDYEQNTIDKLRAAEEEFLKQVKVIEQKAQKEVESVEDKMKALKEDYNKNYVKRSEMQEKLNEMEVFKDELYELKKIVRASEERYESQKSKERELGLKLQEAQDKVNNLRKELDNTTLQYSEAVLEKTKLANEKANLELELNKANNLEVETNRQYQEVLEEFNSAKASFQEQIVLLQNQKSKLEVKISELESDNAELRNRLVKLQALGGKGDHNRSLPNSLSVTMNHEYYKAANRNYSSEDLLDEPSDEERQEASSSPDLGIESDHGRFSSLETHSNVKRPLLQTLALTESMNNLLDGDNNPIEGVICAWFLENASCCQKTQQITHENNDLKKKLLRMRRALEETVSQLNLANQRKKQVEKTICKQIHKTSQVLRKAKANLDSGSETDVFK